MKQKKIGLALSGGGAKGLAHIGVIKALERAQMPIDYIAGTSMGAIVGGWYAATRDIEALERLFVGINGKNILPLHDIMRKRKGAIFRDRSMAERLESRLRGAAIERCAVPFRAVATDAKTGAEVVLKKGSLAKALHASAALPIIFAPVEVDGRELIDGGFSNPVPADVVKKMGADYVVAVDVCSRWFNPATYEVSIKNFYSVISDSLSIVEYQLARRTLQYAHLVLHPPVMQYHWLAFDRVHEITREGERETRRHLREISKGTGHPLPPKLPIEKLLNFLSGQ